MLHDVSAFPLGETVDLGHDDGAFEVDCPLVTRVRSGNVFTNVELCQASFMRELVRSDATVASSDAMYATYRNGLLLGLKMGVNGAASLLSHQANNAGSEAVRQCKYNPFFFFASNICCARIHYSKKNMLYIYFSSFDGAAGEENAELLRKLQADSIAECLEMELPEKFAHVADFFKKLTIPVERVYVCRNGHVHRPFFDEINDSVRPFSSSHAVTSCSICKNNNIMTFLYCDVLHHFIRSFLSSPLVTARRYRFLYKKKSNWDFSELADAAEMEDYLDGRRWYQRSQDPSFAKGFESGEGKDNCVFSVSIDGVEVLSEKAKHSVTVCQLTEMNLPMHLRHLGDNQFVPFVSVGPRAPSSRQLQGILGIMVDRFKMMYSGVTVHNSLAGALETRRGFVHCWIFDTPQIADVLCIAGHSAHVGACPRCHVVGEQCGGSASYGGADNNDSTAFSDDFDIYADDVVKLMKGETPSFWRTKEDYIRDGKKADQLHEEVWKAELGVEQADEATGVEKFSLQREAKRTLKLAQRDYQHHIKGTGVHAYSTLLDLSYFQICDVRFDAGLHDFMGEVRMFWKLLLGVGSKEDYMASSYVGGEYERAAAAAARKNDDNNNKDIDNNNNNNNRDRNRDMLHTTRDDENTTVHELVGTRALLTEEERDIIEARYAAAQRQFPAFIKKIKEPNILQKLPNAKAEEARICARILLPYLFAGLRGTKGDPIPVLWQLFDEAAGLLRERSRKRVVINELPLLHSKMTEYLSRLFKATGGLALRMILHHGIHHIADIVLFGPQCTLQMQGYERFMRYIKGLISQTANGLLEVSLMNKLAMREFFTVSTDLFREHYNKNNNTDVNQESGSQDDRDNQYVRSVLLQMINGSIGSTKTILTEVGNICDEAEREMTAFFARACAELELDVDNDDEFDTATGASAGNHDASAGGRTATYSDASVSRSSICDTLNDDADNKHRRLKLSTLQSKHLVHSQWKKARRHRGSVVDTLMLPKSLHASYAKSFIHIVDASVVSFSTEAKNSIMSSNNFLEAVRRRCGHSDFRVAHIGVFSKVIYNGVPHASLLSDFVVSRYVAEKLHSRGCSSSTQQSRSGRDSRHSLQAYVPAVFQKQQRVRPNHHVSIRSADDGEDSEDSMCFRYFPARVEYFVDVHVRVESAAVSQDSNTAAPDPDRYVFALVQYYNSDLDFTYELYNGIPCINTSETRPHHYCDADLEPTGFVDFVDVENINNPVFIVYDEYSSNLLSIDV